MSTLASVIGLGLHTARPAAGIAGRLYYETDTATLFRDNGSTWDSAEGSAAVADILDLNTVASNTALVLAPDGAGGVEFRAEAGGSGGGATGARYPVQTIRGGQGNSATAAVTLGATPTVGNLLLLTSWNEGGCNITSITQTNVAWEKVTETTASTAPHVELWKGVISGSPGTSVTANYSASGYCGIYVAEWTGLTGTLDQVASQTNGTSHFLPTITPTDASALVVVACSAAAYSLSFVIAGPGLVQDADGAGALLSSNAFGFLGLSPVYGRAGNPSSSTYASFLVASIT